MTAVGVDARAWTAMPNALEPASNRRADQRGRPCPADRLSEPDPDRHRRDSRVRRPRRAPRPDDAARTRARRADRAARQRGGVAASGDALESGPVVRPPTRPSRASRRGSPAGCRRRRACPRPRRAGPRGVRRDQRAGHHRRDRRSSQNSTGRSRSGLRLRTKARVDCTRGPSLPSMLSGRPITSPPTACCSHRARSRAASGVNLHRADRLAAARRSAAEIGQARARSSWCRDRSRSGAARRARPRRRCRRRVRVRRDPESRRPVAQGEDAGLLLQHRPAPGRPRCPRNGRGQRARCRRRACRGSPAPARRRIRSERSSPPKRTVSRSARQHPDLVLARPGTRPRTGSRRPRACAEEAGALETARIVALDAEAVRRVGCRPWIAAATLSAIDSGPRRQVGGRRARPGTAIRKMPARRARRRRCGRSCGSCPAGQSRAPPRPARGVRVAAIPARMKRVEHGLPHRTTRSLHRR